MDTDKNFCVRYISGNNSDNYVGSIQDYREGGVADPVLMTEDEARTLHNDLMLYVESEYIGNNDEDNEQAHYAYRKGEWGFVVEELDLPVISEEEEEPEYANTGLDRSVRAMPYVVGRMIAITEHYAVSKFGALTLSNMFTHPRYYIDAFRRYIDKEDMYYNELKDIELPVVIKSPVEQGQIWIGYYHQKSAYEHTHGMTIAERLKSAREKQGMTLQALSQSTCINISNLSKIESGKVDPKLSTVQTICKALGLTLRIE